jgi:hypothetical protein
MYIYIYYLAGIKLKEDQQPTAQSTITKMQQQNATTKCNNSNNSSFDCLNEPEEVPIGLAFLGASTTHSR